MKKKKSKRSPIIKTDYYKVNHSKPYLFLTVCGDCRIRLVVHHDKANACDLCKSLNVVATSWEQNTNG